MKIHGICLVKNEDDIIAQTLKTAIEWCDFIYIFDNGSSDRTWEIILALSEKYEQIIPYKREDCAYSDLLRREVFNHYRANCSENDWWCLLDADEFYIDNPKIFLAKIPKQYQVVWSASFQYYFTDKALELYQANPSLYADDVAVEYKCRYYLNNWSEPRFFRYQKSLIWDKGKVPNNFGSIYPQRIRLKHYQYRSPQQIQKRLKTRYEARTKGSKDFTHEIQNNWQATIVDTSQLSIATQFKETGFERSWEERIISASLLTYDNHDGIYLERQDLMPKLPNHKRKFWKNLFKKAKKMLIN